jgi:hypothetical protein
MSAPGKEPDYVATPLKYSSPSYEELFYKSKSEGTVPSGRGKAEEMCTDPKYTDDTKPYHIFYSESQGKYIGILNTKHQTGQESYDEMIRDGKKYKLTRSGIGGRRRSRKASKSRKAHKSRKASKSRKAHRHH